MNWKQLHYENGYKINIQFKSKLEKTGPSWIEISKLSDSCVTNIEQKYKQGNELLPFHNLTDLKLTGII